MDHSVRLDRLPDEVTIPENLRERVRYDPDRKTLSFRGFMSQRCFESLLALSKDYHYRRAVEELFVHTSQEVVPQVQRGRASPLALGTALLLVLGGAAICWYCFY